MGQLGVSDAQLAAMLDVAGEKLRADHLLWMDKRPDITVLAADQGGPAMAFEYRVDVTPAVAAQMTWDLAEALVTRDLNRPHIAVGFLGTRLQACVAA